MAERKKDPDAEVKQVGVNPGYVAFQIAKAHMTGEEAVTEKEAASSGLLGYDVCVEQISWQNQRLHKDRGGRRISNEEHKDRYS